MLTVKLYRKGLARAASIGGQGRMRMLLLGAGLCVLCLLVWSLTRDAGQKSVTIDIAPYTTPPELDAMAGTALQGFSAEVLVRIDRLDAGTGKIIFDRHSPEGASASLLLSQRGSLVLSATDIQGRSYSLEIPFNRGEVPLRAPIHLSCEIGVADSYTVMRVLVNGRTIRYRLLRAPLKLGFGGWQDSDMDVLEHDGDGAPFTVRVVSVANDTLTDRERANYRAMMSRNLRQIGGGQWLGAFAN